jgi:predicted DNA-binding transcriptional regulator AlpA
MIEPTPTTLTLPCGEKSTGLVCSGRLDPEQFRSHVLGCVPCAALVDAVRAALGPANKEFYSPRELAHFLGMSPRSIYRLLNSDTIPHYRFPSGKLGVRWRDLEDWMSQYRTAS